MTNYTLDSNKGSVTVISPDDFYLFEYELNGVPVARIEYDDSNYTTQPWVILIGSREFSRTNSFSKSENVLMWHLNQGSLPSVASTLESALYSLEFIDKSSNFGYVYSFKSISTSARLGFLFFDNSRGLWSNDCNSWESDALQAANKVLQTV